MTDTKMLEALVDSSLNCIKKNIGNIYPDLKSEVLDARQYWKGFFLQFFPDKVQHMMDYYDDKARELVGDLHGTTN